MTDKNNIALSFDVEDWYHAAGVSGSSYSLYKSLNDFLDRNRKNEIADRITEETIKLVNILNSYNLQATFFVVADVALRYPKLTKVLKESKHEIASHSFDHQSAYDPKMDRDIQPRNEWLEQQKKAKEILENIFERGVIGFRAPNAHFTNWMIPLLEKLGFKYDSSITYNSIYNKTNVRLKHIPSHPYYLNSEDLSSKNPDSGLLEIPWSNLKVFNNLILPGGGAFFFRSLGARYFKFLLDKALDSGDTMFYLHPLDISRGKIPMNNNSSRPFYWINKGIRTERRFIKILDKYKSRLVSCKEVYLKHAKK